MNLKDIKLSTKDLQKGLKLPEIITPDLAYLLGVFAGDGSIYYNLEKHTYQLKCVGNPKDEKEYYNKVLGPKFRKVFGFTPKIRLLDGKTTYGFTVHSKALCEYLMLLGLPSGVKYDKLEVLKALENKNIIHFIRGLFDTDGCMCFKKRYRDYPYYPVISLCSKSTLLIREVTSLLKILGFRVSTTLNYKAKDSRIIQGYSIRNWVELNGKYNFNLWNDIICFYSPKHLAKIEKWKSTEVLPPNTQ